MKGRLIWVRRSISYGIVFVGVGLEHFDAMLVNLFATSMTGHFVNVTSENHKMILGFTGFGISFLFRPVGAAVFGRIGDSLGRKVSMLLSLFFMSIATFGLGLIPSYSEWGGYSTFLFVLCRIVQGMSIGGEYGAAMTYAYEFSENRKTSAGAWVISATHLGGFMASLVAMKYSFRFQIPFLIAGVLGLFSLGLRSWVIESSEVRTSSQQKSLSIKELFQLNYKNRTSYYRSFVVSSALVLPFYTSLIYLNEIIFQRKLASREDLFFYTSLILGLWIILSPILGSCVDRFRLDYRRWMFGGAAAVGLSIAPLLVVAGAFNQIQVWIFIQGVLNFFHCIYCFSTPRYLGDQFETSSRNTGVALGYSLGASFTAALTPLLCHGLVVLFGRVEAVAIPIIILTSAVCFQLRKKEQYAK